MLKLDLTEANILVQLVEQGQFKGEHVVVIAKILEKLRRETDKLMEKELK